MEPKGVYIAGGNQHAGKTTVSLGLVKHFNEKLNGKVSFIKPIGQKSVSVEGENVGQDSYLLNRALNLNIPLKYSAPFSSGAGAAYKYIKEGEPKDISNRIKKAYKHLAYSSNLTIVEGTGHPGVGSVFNLSNGKIAASLDTPALLILNAGIGSTIDRFTLCKSVFERENAKILGVIINRVNPDKYDKIKDALDRWFSNQGIPVFGYIPYLKEITEPNSDSFLKAIKSEPLTKIEKQSSFKIDKFITAFGSIEKVLERTDAQRNTAVILDSSRLEIIYPLITRKSTENFHNTPSAIIICGDNYLPTWTIEASEKARLPIYRTPLNTTKVSAIVESKIFKVEPQESDKITNILKLTEKHVDFEGIYRALSNPSEVVVYQSQSLINRIIRKGAKLIYKFIK